MYLLLLALVVCTSAAGLVVKTEYSAPPGYVIYYGGDGAATCSLTELTCVPAGHGKDNRPR